MISSTNILVHGSATIDLICSGFYEIDGSRVLIRLSPKSKESIELEVSDGPITISAKHTLTRSLERIVEVPHIYSTSGGGGIRSVNALGAMDHDLRLTFLGLSEPHQYFEQDFRLRGISSRFLGKHKVPINLVLGIGGDRTLLRSPISAEPFDQHANNRAIDEAVASSDVVLINSVKDPKLADYLLENCAQHRVVSGYGDAQRETNSPIPAYVVVTPSFGIDKAGKHPHIISSYEDLLTLYGISKQKRKQDFENAVNILSRLQTGIGKRHFYVTLGKYGAIYCNKDLMGHVLLKRGVWKEVQSYLRRNPEMKNGTGDIFAAAVVYYETILNGSADLADITKRACLACVQYFRFPGEVALDSFVVQQIK